MTLTSPPLADDAVADLLLRPPSLLPAACADAGAGARVATRGV